MAELNHFDFIITGPVRTGNWTACDPVCLEQLPELPGVYALYDDNKVVYIGSAANLRARFRSHRFMCSNYSACTNTAWGPIYACYAKYWVSRRYGDWLMLEARLIRRLQPVFNVRHTNRSRKGVVL